MEKIEKIKEFIINNGLDFSGTGSDLNGNCTILAGYALFIEIDVHILFQYLAELPDKTFTFAYNEFDRVYEYAKLKSYGNWWHTADAKTKYKF